MKTQKNLLKAFAGESQARNRYLMYAKVAKKEGYEKISEMFVKTADNELEHAKLFYKQLKGGMLEMTASYPAGDIGTTLENLEFAANGEQEESEVLYPEFAKVAREEGHEEVALLFEKIAKIEAHHNKRYNILYNAVKNDFFNRTQDTIWECRECGYIYVGSTPPEMCPVCDHPRSYYQLNLEIY